MVKKEIKRALLILNRACLARLLHSAFPRSSTFPNQFNDLFVFLLEMEMVEAVALIDYHGKTNRELSFKKNQIISIEKKLNSEWWFGSLADKKQSGLIPDGSIKLRSRFVIINDRLFLN